MFENPVAGAGPILLATRIEDPALPTVLGCGHGDVIRGLAEKWTKGGGPWRAVRAGDRLYGRGTSDNKGQHSINMAALGAVIAARGALGFNARFMIETGEENGSAGVQEVVAADREAFAADVFIASDGPRVRPDRPTISLGARGALNFDLVCALREGGHHSGNWGGALADPAAILAHAIATIVGTDAEGALEALRRHLPAHGITRVEVRPPPPENAGGFSASRTEIDHPWAVWVRERLAAAAGMRPAVLPQMGGSICNEVFTDTLGLPAIRIPYSCAGCSQHAPDEHVLLPLCREALLLMTNLYWDLGDPALEKP